MRDLRRILATLENVADGAAAFEPFQREELTSFGLDQIEIGGGRFQPELRWEAGDDVADRVAEALLLEQLELDALVEAQFRS